MMRKACWSNCVLPPRLRAGDRIAIAAPSGPVPREGFLAGLELLASRYRVVYDEHLLDRTGFLAGPDERRVEELNRYVRDPDVRAIFCARGGYGATRILAELDGAALRRDPKVVVGFSDVTALLAWAVLEGQVRPVHGPMVVQLAKLPADDLAWLFRLLEDPTPPGLLADGLARVGDRGGGSVDGRLVGGNLELCTRLIGTPWQLDLGAAVLFLEEVGERPYRIDRALTQLQAAGALDGVRAVAIGDLVSCTEPDASPPTAAEVIAERLRSFELPGVAGLPIGHGDRNRAIPVGARCTLDLARGEILLDDGAVR